MNMKEIIEQIKETDDYTVIVEDVIEEFDDIDELEEVEDEIVCFIDNGKEYQLIFLNGFGFSIIKGLEPERFCVLAYMKNEFQIHRFGFKEEFILNSFSAKEMVIRDNWITAYPIIEKLGLLIGLKIPVGSIPKGIRKDFFKRLSKEKDSSEYQYYLEEFNLIELCVELGFNTEQLIKLYEDKYLMRLIGDASSLGVSDNILLTLNEELINDEIIRLVHDGEDFVIDENLSENEQNYRYCEAYKDKKVPYYDFFEEKGYKIISPTNFIELAEASEYMHNCVGKPHQGYIQQILNKELEVYFLKKGETHVATIGVEDNSINTCLGRFNSYCEEEKDGKKWFTQEEALIVDNWGKQRGFVLNY